MIAGAVFALGLVMVCAAATRAQTAKIASIKVTGSQRYPEEKIIAESGLAAGQTVTKEEIQAAADRLAQLGPFVNATYSFTSKEKEIALKFQVQDAPTVPVAFDNFPWFSDEELVAAIREAAPLFDGTAPEQGKILETMTVAVQRLVDAKKIQGSVALELITRPTEEGMMQQFRLKGPVLKVNGVEYSDPVAAGSARLAEEAKVLVGQPFSRYAVQVFLVEKVRPLYLASGYLRVKFGEPQALFSGNPTRPLPDNVKVRIVLEPGPVYTWNGATWGGNKVFEAWALDGMLKMAKGLAVNATSLEDAWERVKQEYGQKGYVEAELKAEPVFDDAAGKVAYRVTVTEGPQYKMGKLVITGLSVPAERALRTAWKIREGEIFDRAYYEEFVTKGIKAAWGEMVVTAELRGKLLQTYPERSVLDVLLDFR